LQNVLVTGGLGFIGSHFIRQILTKEKQKISSVTNIDFIGYGSHRDNLKDVNDTRYKYIKANINNKEALESVGAAEDIDTIVNFAAETHVDRSISNPTEFVDSNVIGVLSLLEFCRLNDVQLFVQISTDEVYGDATDRRRLDEDSPLKPNSPYSASKASADLLTRAYNKTYGIKTVITRCSNNFGPNQFPEKLIPKTIIRALKGLSIPLYGDGQQIREWLYVKDHVNAIIKVITKGKSGEIYNISSSSELSNVVLVNRIAGIVERYSPAVDIMIEYVKDRPGHDTRYSLDSSKINEELNWEPIYSFDSSLEETVRWYIDNEWWWTSLLTDKVLEVQPWRSS
jgi:dTDP-glucose 4,6-dehydratase